MSSYRRFPCSESSLHLLQNLRLERYVGVNWLLQAKSLTEELGNGLVLMVNPQWQTGQLISDLGFGPWRRRNEEFIDSFQNVYSLKRLRYCPTAACSTESQGCQLQGKHSSNLPTAQVEMVLIAFYLDQYLPWVCRISGDNVR